MGVKRLMCIVLCIVDEIAILGLGFATMECVVMEIFGVGLLLNI